MSTRTKIPRKVGRETQAVATYDGPVEPYQHEPLAHDTNTDAGSDNCESSSEHELDIDGLPPAILQVRCETILMSRTGKFQRCLFFISVNK